MSSWQRAKAIMEAGNAKDWGKVIEIHKMKDLFGLGYQPSLGEMDVQASKGEILHMHETFISDGDIFEGHVEMINEVAYDGVISIWIRQGAPGEELNNWKAAEIPRVFQIIKITPRPLKNCTD